MRREFPKPVKRAALARSGNLCEGEGALYGLAPGKRCNADLAYGAHFDHVLADSNGGEPVLENCAAVCRDCHAFKTAKHDTPRAAKIKRVKDRHHGIRGPRKPWPSRKFSAPRISNTKHLDRL